MNNTNTKATLGLNDLPASNLAKMYSSSDLFGQSSSVVINHRGVCYTLRITQLGKLILTK